MDFVTPLVTGGLLAVFTVLLTVLGKTQFDSLRGEISELRTEMRSEVAAIRSDIAAIRSEMAIMRSDLTHVALAVGVEPRPQTG